MSLTSLRLTPGTLWPAIVDRTRHALACGALEPIETRETIVEDGGLRFAIRRASSLALKALRAGAGASAESAPQRNPFLPPDPDLVVGDVSETHVAVLNRFPVIAHHLLVVTREYVEQAAPLDEDDFAALLACLAEFPSLGFYNGGAGAGASQPHKHLQVVPLPLAEGVPLACDLALEPRGSGRVLRVPAFDFAHAVAATEPEWLRDPVTAAPAITARYHALLAAASVAGGPYNLLVSARQMLVVPRAQERFRGVSINALGFAGSLFAKDDQELAILRHARPRAVLAAVAKPRPRLFRER